MSSKNTSTVLSAWGKREFPLVSLSLVQQSYYPFSFLPLLTPLHSGRVFYKLEFVSARFPVGVSGMLLFISLLKC